VSYYNDQPCASGPSLGYQTPEQEAKCKREFIINQLVRAVENAAGLSVQLSGDARKDVDDAVGSLIAASDKFKRGF
jgi:hypothetical protein